MPNRLCAERPSRVTISFLPHPVSRAAWASMNLAGMPVILLAISASACRRFWKASTWAGLLELRRCLPLRPSWSVLSACCWLAKLWMNLARSASLISLTSGIPMGKPSSPGMVVPSRSCASGSFLGSEADSWRVSTSASPTPRCARLWLNCWSSMEVNILVCSLSNGPFCGVASRMLFITMFRNSASNCLAAPLMASGEFCRAASRRPFSPFASTARFSVGLDGLILLSMGYLG